MASSPAAVVPAVQVMKVDAAAPQVVPVVAVAQPVMVAPGQQVMVATGPPPTDLSILANVSKVVIKQKVKLMEAVTQGCCEQSNTYEVLDAATGVALLRAHERSGGFSRICCAPNHDLRLEVNALHNGAEVGTVMTMERPFVCSLCTWADICADGANFHRGRVEGSPGSMPQDAVFASAKQPHCGGGMTPTVMLRTPATPDPYAVVQGPMCFGGASKFCCSATFDISNLPPGKGPADVLNNADHAVLVKEKPKSFTGALREALTDSDVFTLQFKDPNMSLEQKAGTLGSIFLLDYMFFERDGDLISFNDDGSVNLNLCNMSCCGMVVPCQISGGGGSDGGGGGGD